MCEERSHSRRRHDGPHCRERVSRKKIQLRRSACTPERMAERSSCIGEKSTVSKDDFRMRLSIRYVGGGNPMVGHPHDGNSAQSTRLAMGVRPPSIYRAAPNATHARRATIPSDAASSAPSSSPNGETNKTVATPDNHPRRILVSVVQPTATERIAASPSRHSEKRWWR